MNRLVKFVALAVVVFIIGLAPIRADDPVPVDLGKLAELLKEGKPAFTLAQAKAYVKELLPLVEQATGRKFKRVPVVKLVCRGELVKVLTGELVPQFGALTPGMDGQKIKEAVNRQARMMASMLLGKYRLRDEVMYLLPRNFNPLMKLLRVDGKYSVPIIKLVVAHELTHVLQDQQVGLEEKLSQVRSMDEAQAFNATIEGHAVFIQEKVGRALKLGDAVQEHSRLLAAGAVRLDDPALEMINRIISSQFAQIYLRGRKFIEYQDELGGNDRLWHILAAPPVSSSMIVKPEQYSPVRSAKFDYGRLLEGLEKEFGKRDWMVRNLELGQMSLTAFYGVVEPEKHQEIITNLKHVQALMVQTSKPAALGGVTIFIFRDAKYVRRFVALMEQAARRNAQSVSHSSTFSVEKLVIEDFPGVQADVSRKVSLEMEALKGTHWKQVIFRIARGEFLLEISDGNIGLADQRVIAIAEEVFQRYGALVPR